MDPKERRQTGGHYTSERDIQKVINPLFMDGLRAEFEKVRHNKNMLRQFHEKLGRLEFFDPACGCGNFLVITYRELRLLEIEVLRALHGDAGEGVQQQLDVLSLSKLRMDVFHGIEIQEWPARIAEVAMWLMDHQMTLRLSEAFGQYFVRLPLKNSAHIVLGNALRLDWKQILPPDQCAYILGNPPFIGKHYQTAEQKADMAVVFGDFKNIGDLDYVTCWHYLAAQYIQGTAVVVCFVSTNSITQGEQVPLIWGLLFNKWHIKIHFAHRTFKWQSEARGKAHVHVVVIGFATYDISTKKLYDYEAWEDTATLSEVYNISPYLTDDLYLFGILTSSMHMAWMRLVGGRLESRYRYSRTMVYNTFPWPPDDGKDVVSTNAQAKPLGTVNEAAARIYWSSYHEGGDKEPVPGPPPRLKGDAKKRGMVETLAQAVLDVRLKYPLSTLADLYDPLTMPPDLVKAHADLDRSVDQCYRPQPFSSDRQRVEYLFALYERLSAPLLPEKKKRSPKNVPS